MTKEAPKILIVDDDKSFREIVKAILKDKCHCITAANGEDAVEAYIESFRNNEPRFDAILLDVEMPGMNGLETLMALRKAEKQRDIDSKKQLKIIMSTSHNDRNVVLACKAAGCNHYILKPVEPHALLEKLYRLDILPFQESGPMPEEIPDF